MPNPFAKKRARKASSKGLEVRIKGEGRRESAVDKRKRRAAASTGAADVRVEQELTQGVARDTVAFLRSKAAPSGSSAGAAFRRSPRYDSRR